MKYAFNEVSVKGEKRWKDENGKWRRKTKKFYQTLSPFNKNPDGSLKSREEIMAQITAECDAWIADPSAK